MFNYTRHLPGVLFLVIMLWLQGCAVAPQVERLEQEPIQVAPQIELTDVPFFPQAKYQCGPAALATVLQYRQISVLPDDLVSKVYVPNRQGSFQVEMVSAVRQFGLMPYVIKPSMEDLLFEVEAGNPVLVLQNLAFESYPQWHFAVVIGYDIEKSQITLRSGTTKRWQTSLRNFEQTWRKSSYWGMVITPPNELPKTATLSKWLAVAYDLEQVNQIVAAEKAYVTATQHWPQKESPWLALTNLQYSQKRYVEALNQFNTALPSFKHNAQMWNNYAYVLKANGCVQAAKMAANCAVKLEPNDKNLLQTQQEMLKLPSQPKSCSVVNCPLK